MRRGAYLPILFGMVVLAMLVFLYVQARSIDLARYSLVNETVADLQRLDAELGQEVLRIRQGLVNHYDFLNDRMRRIEEQVGHLEQGLGELAEPGGSLFGSMALVRGAQEKLRQAVNDYVSQNALMRNSENYLPGEIRRLAAELRPSNSRLADRLDDDLLDNLLLYLLKGDGKSRSRVMQAITDLWGAGADERGEVVPQLANVLSHATLLVERKHAVDHLVHQMLDMGLSQRLGILYDSYRQDHLAKQRRAGFYRMGLFLMASALLGYLVHLLLKMARTTRALRRSLSAIQQAQETLRIQASALEAAANAIVITDREGRIQWVNEAFSHLTGYSREEALGENPRILNSGVHSEDVYRLLWNTILDGRVWSGELVNRRKDGKLYVEEETITPVRDEEGEITHFIAIKNDITERRHTERALRRANRALRVLSEVNQILVRAGSEQQLLDDICRAIHEAGGFCLVWIGRAEQDEEKTVRPLAWAGESEAGDYVRTLKIRWDDSEYGRGPTGTAIRTCKPMVVTDTNRDPNYGPWREAARRYGFRSSVALPLGRPDACWGVLNIYSATQDSFDSEEIALLQELADDIEFGVKALQFHDERHQLRRQLQQAQKMEAIGQLTGGIAHDFNNILASIMGYAGLALDRFGEKCEPKLRDYLEEVYRAGERARDLIAQLLAFSRADSSEARALPLAPMIKEAVKLLGSTLPASIEVRLDIDHGVSDARIDPVHLHQIVMNLCINARDAMDGRGQIEIGLHQTRCKGERCCRCVCASCHQNFEGDYVELRIANDGPPIPPEMLERIFEPFYTTKEVGKGTGMGLSMVHGIVHEHGGHILVENGESRGVAFRIFLPAVASAEASAEGDEARRSLPLPACGRLLIVDDEEAVAGFMAELMETHGYEVATETNGAEALELFRTAPEAFDLLIIDQTMPGLSGGELAREVLALRPDLPIVLCTGYSEEMDEAKARAIGIRAYLAKPVAARDLLDTVANLLTVEATHE